MARIWRGGCIIRARLLPEIDRAYRTKPDLPNLILDETLGAAIKAAEPGWRRAVGVAQELGIPVPAFASALAYFDAYTSAELPTRLTQAQRDAFGAHTYRRVDHPDRGPMHTDWLAAK
jgi:6-phosphogluconate dehydrogenase